MARSRVLWLSLLLPAFGAGPLHAQPTDPDLREEALRALKKAATFYRGKVASHGGYVYYYSAGPQAALGRGEGDRRHDLRAAARERRPSAWPTSRPTPRRATSSTSTPPAKRPRPWSTGSCSPAAGRRSSTSAPAKRMGKYRNGKGGSWNVSSLDDGQTQAALQMLIRADRALDFKHAEIHEAAAVRARRPAQGAVPQRGLPAGVDRPRGAEARGQGQVPGLRLEDRGPGQELLGLLHPQRQPGGDRRRHAHRRAPGLQGREVQGRAARSSATS